LEQNIVHFLGADVRLEGGLGGGQVDDDVADIFFNTNLLESLIGSDSRIP
jgi:hypothetical protein